MRNPERRNRRLRGSALAVVFLLGSGLAFASLHRSESWARTQFAAAERLHQALEARPASDLKRADYERVINAYRRVYLESPASTRADPSVVGTAQLLEEMGRRFSDDEVLRSAVKEYQFLRQQYPGSKARFAALFHIGEIYKEDLHDKEHADEVFREFLQRYPRNQFAEEARKALAGPVETAGLKSRVVKRSHDESPKLDSPSTDNAEDFSPDRDQSGSTTQSTEAESITSPPQAPKGKITRVTGMRHWLTPDSLCVAIDLDQGVKFDSQRIDHPDRVFFDLFDARLDPGLAKSLDLDDSLVRKIRISQFNRTRTRLVLELNGAAAFKASFLPDPPRLQIIIPSRPTKDVEEAGADRTPPESPAVEPRAKTVSETDSDAGPVTKIVVEKPAKPAAAPSKACGDQDSENCTAPADSANPRTTFTTSEGVRKTVVDNDDEDAKPKPHQVAKLDVPESKPDGQLLSTVSPPDPPKDRSRTAKGKRNSTPTPPEMREAQPTSGGDRSLIRALGLKIGKIVIDPGHGGHDTGTIGPNGLEEKDLVLDVSQRLGKLLVTRLGAEVIYTRKDDTFIPLETRTAIANQEGADLFVSVHANSSHDPDARGVETYYLNFTSSPDALEVAARENSVSDKSIHELQDLVKKIALKEKIEESHEFAADVEESLHSGLAGKNPGLRDRGVKKAPFIVLIGANMPSILAEISFVSNPGDERRLRKTEYRQKIAESLYRGIAKYVNGLSGVRVASKIDKGDSQ